MTDLIFMTKAWLNMNDVFIMPTNFNCTFNIICCDRVFNIIRCDKVSLECVGMMNLCALIWIFHKVLFLHFLLI